MAGVRKNEQNNDNQNGFKIVPESVEDITMEWLEQALRKGCTISEETKILNVELQCLTNDEIGEGGEDGGGLSGSTLVKLVPTYG